MFLLSLWVTQKQHTFIIEDQKNTQELIKRTYINYFSLFGFELQERCVNKWNVEGEIAQLVRVTHWASSVNVNLVGSEPVMTVTMTVTILLFFLVSSLTVSSIIY